MRLTFAWHHSSKRISPLLFFSKTFLFFSFFLKMKSRRVASRLPRESRRIDRFAKLDWQVADRTARGSARMIMRAEDSRSHATLFGGKKQLDVNLSSDANPPDRRPPFSAIFFFAQVADLADEKIRQRQQTRVC